MRIKFLGTSTGEGLPALYCNCDLCNFARKKQKKDIRKPSQILINNDLLLNLPAATQYNFNMDFSSIKYLLLSNNNPENLHAYSLILRSSEYVSQDLSPIQIFGSMPTIDFIFDSLRKAGVNNQKRWILNEVSPYREISAGNYKITPLKAKYEFRSFPYIYEICDKNKNILFAQNTGFFLKETLNYISDNKKHYNAVILDCTKPHEATNDQSFYMNIYDCRKIKDTLICNGNADNNTTFLLTHFSHNSGLCHSELVKTVKDDGFIIAYDLLEINI